MFTGTKRYGLAALASTVLLGLAASTAQAQIPINWLDPYGNSRRAAFNIALYGRAMQRVPPYALGFNPYPPPIVAGGYGGGAYPPFGLWNGGGGTLANNMYGAGMYSSSPGLGSYTDPYGGYGGYYPYYNDPLNGLLRGSADVVAAQGQYLINNEQSKLLREQRRQAEIDTRRRRFDEWLYERNTRPTLQDERERQDKIALRYYLTNPASTEIYSATSLNAILDQLQQMQAKGMRGPNLPLEEDTLKQINVSPSGGNVGLLKNEGRLTWPAVLAGADFAAERKSLDSNLPTSISEVEKHGQVDRGRLMDMLSDVDKMYQRLALQIGELTPSQYIEAKRYLNQLSDALRALQSPDAGNYFTGKYVARGKTVGELVKNMNGLRFAPATPGEERAYREVYQALAAYYAGAQGTASGGTSGTAAGAGAAAP
jgi:hypothetical protein